MLPVSAAFLAAVRSSHAMVSRVRLITPGAEGADPAGTDLRIVDGAVTLDATADIRGRLDITLAEPWPSGNTTADLVPYGSELAVSRGVVFGNGNIERAPLGIYRITNVEQAEAPKGALRIVAQDRMSVIVDAKLLAPVQYLASETYGALVADLVTAVLPGQTIEWDDATNVTTIGRVVVIEEDRAGALRDIVASVGKVAYFDYRGVLVIVATPDPGEPVWEAAAGAGGVLTTVGRSLSRDGVFNAVAATGEALDDTTAPPLGIAYDADPHSVTYWAGPFGQVPRAYSSPFITTAAQAIAAARTILLQSIGLPYEVNFSAVPNPAVEPLDPIRLVYPPVLGNAPVVKREVHVLDRITIPLDAGGVLSAATRLTTLTTQTSSTEPT